jgi:signal transduction histidine kinase
MSLRSPQAVLRWFSIPDLPRPDLQRHARALWLVSWPLLAIVVISLAAAVLVEPSTFARRATTAAAVAVLVCVLHVVSRGGRPLLASWVLVLGLSIIVTERAWMTGGIHAPVSAFYALFIVMAGAIIGFRASLVTAGVCFLGAVVLTLATWEHWLGVPLNAGSPIAQLVFVALCIGLAMVLQPLIALGTKRDRPAADAAQMLAHDLRSPMQVLIAHLEILRERARGDDAKEIDGAMGRVAALNRLTSSFLDLSRIESGQMPVQRSITDVSVLAQSVVAPLRALQPERRLTVETQGDPLCHCDRELTRRIIENLVNNAMKHTEVRGAVRVIVDGSARAVVIAVHDEGAGVPPETRKKIFDPYFSGSGLISKAGLESSGLGLTFCRLAAEAQGGSIRIEDGAGRGSVFVVELPR